jgi:type II secretory pathway pseudopilin PulG
MNDVIQPHKKSRFTWLHALVALVPVAILASLVVPTFGRICARGNITKGISNCRQIITAMRIYSSDHGGAYPDAALENPQSSNEAFRRLFTKEVLDNELIFGCPISRFVPDGNIGKTPDFQQALEADENHWAMTKGVSDSDPGSIPLVYENPVKPTWPPVWNADAKGKNVRGRAWSNGVIIGMNDSSVGIQPLQSKAGTEVPLKDLNDGEGKNLFSQHGKDWTILNVEAAPGAK